MVQDYEGILVCVQCLAGRLNTQLTDKFLDEVDNKLMENDVFKNISREMFYENPNNLYVPQLEDEVYFIFQGYEEVVAYYPYHFITLEEERNRPINDYFEVLLKERLMSKSPLTHEPVK
jgi:hypothetical protein